MLIGSEVILFPPSSSQMKSLYYLLDSDQIYKYSLLLILLSSFLEYDITDFQKHMSTQVFILCDKPKDASLILISYRGTEPFDADDWSTDFDYSWYEIPKLGKVHVGFLEALGLGNRTDATTFQNQLLVKNINIAVSDDDVFDTSAPSDTRSSSLNRSYDMEGHASAYYAVRQKLKILLEEHKTAKFIVTGHSLGGALAILFPTVLVLHEEMELMQRLLGVYTFGQPRVGNGKLGRFMKAHLEYPIHKYFRVVYCNDLVPRLPYDDKIFLYNHFGMCLYYDSRYMEKVCMDAFKFMHFFHFFFFFAIISHIDPA